MYELSELAGGTPHTVLCNTTEIIMQLCISYQNWRVARLIQSDVTQEIICSYVLAIRTGSWYASYSLM